MLDTTRAHAITPRAMPHIALTSLGVRLNIMQLREQLQITCDLREQLQITCELREQLQITCELREQLQITCELRKQP